MIETLLTFLGGSAFRLIFGQIINVINRREEHRMECERLEREDLFADKQHARNQDAIRLQHELGVDTIRVKSDADAALMDIQAFNDAVSSVGRTTGVYFIDAWNGSIRPLLATLSIAVFVFEIYQTGGVLSDWHRGLVSAILGVYVADRQMSKRGI